MDALEQFIAVASLRFKSDRAYRTRLLREMESSIAETLSKVHDAA